MSNQIKVCSVASYAEISELKFHPENPRTIKDDRLQLLKESIIQKGFYQPILVWKKGGIVLAGNHRLMAAQELVNEGWEFINAKGKLNVLPVVIEDVSKEEAMAILLETNNTYAEWIDDKLAAALRGMEEQGHSILSVGFTQQEADNLLTKAMKDAEDIIGTSPGKGPGLPPEPKSTPADMDEVKKEEEQVGFEALMLPTPAYKEMRKLLDTIVARIAPKSTDPKVLGVAVQALTRACSENDIVDYIAGMMG